MAYVCCFQIMHCNYFSPLTPFPSHYSQDIAMQRAVEVWKLVRNARLLDTWILPEPPVCKTVWDVQLAASVMSQAWVRVNASPIGGRVCTDNFSMPLYHLYTISSIPPPLFASSSFFFFLLILLLLPLSSLYALCLYSCNETAYKVNAMFEGCNSATQECGTLDQRQTYPTMRKPSEYYLCKDKQVFVRYAENVRSFIYIKRVVIYTGFCWI